MHLKEAELRLKSSLQIYGPHHFEQRRDNGMAWKKVQVDVPFNFYSFLAVLLFTHRMDNMKDTSSSTAAVTARPNVVAGGISMVTTG